MRNSCYRALAAAVINQAVKDATRPDPEPLELADGTAADTRRKWRKDGNEGWIKQDALCFLGTHNEDLHMWCRIANIDAGVVVKRFKEQYEQVRPKEAA